MWMRFVVVVIGLAWASLLLVSWSGSTPVPESAQNQTTQAERR